MYVTGGAGRMSVPTREEFLNGVQEYERQEKRDAIYKVATFLLEHFWGRPSDMADALGVLLLTWNQAFYRYGPFDFDRLESCIAENLCGIERFRSREISSLSSKDRVEVEELFGEFLAALEISSGKAHGRRSPVAVAKALHLLAPRFFPLWDNKIARAYRCRYVYRSASRYFDFCEIMKEIADGVRGYLRSSERTLVKLVDQYNYLKYTQGWI